MQNEELVKERSKIRLDVGCGANKRPGWVGLDVREMDGVDIVHNILEIPWPVPDDSACIIQLSHLIEHLPPTSYRLKKKYNQPGGTLLDVELESFWTLPAIMNEMWRILEDDGQVWITAPYGWSHGFVQDPTHAKPINETLFQYFDPQCYLYSIYKPRPWRINTVEYQLGGNILAVLNTRKDPSWDEHTKLK